jgi:hypothetical protein
MKHWILIIFCLAVWGCAKSPAPDQAAEAQRTNSQIVSGAQENTAVFNTVAFTIEDITLSVPRPQNWELHRTAFGVVLAEHIGSIATDGELGGILAHVWLQPLTDFNLQASTRENAAWAILGQIIENPEYVGSATVSGPAGFIWDGNDAAYYLLDNGDGNLSVVIGVIVPGTGRLITISVSAPAAQAARIRPLLPQTLHGLRINNSTLSGSALDQLPDPLVFPQHEAEAQGHAIEPS